MRRNIVIGLAALILLTAGAYWYSLQGDKCDGTKCGPVACTEEAKLCPDGSYVGRSGPRCEFAECPVVSVPADWLATTTAAASFRYPEDFSTTYIRPFDWPPQAQVLNEPYECTEAGRETERAGRTEIRTVDDREYCVTRLVQGAAGSIYTQHAYAAARGDKTVILTFTTRAPQCANYPEEEMRRCEAEREAFDLDAVVDRMMRSVTLN